MSTASGILGVDIGGANLKVAHEGGARAELSYALWRDPAALPERLESLVARLPPMDGVRAACTAELCDCFASRAEGVARITRAVEAWAGRCPVRFWSTEGRLVGPERARGEPLAVASANWHALATAAARERAGERVLLMDVGSTTSDLIPLEDGAPRPAGLTDADRLRHRELLYLGIERTPLMALGPEIPWEGAPVPLMAERFADTADVFLCSGERAEAPEQEDTADGAARTRAAAARRLARMVGTDADRLSESRLRALADAFAARASSRLVEAARAAAPWTPDRVLLSGSGAFLAEAAAREAFGGGIPLEHRKTGEDTGCAEALLEL
jgi:probable H4MPT-linked C1 transfer pathway protein